MTASDVLVNWVLFPFLNGLGMGTASVIWRFGFGFGRQTSSITGSITGSVTGSSSSSSVTGTQQASQQARRQ
ncbi:hypothetical protein BC831DRAFT_460990, partial [Entophlyctis helioformis]